VGMKFICKADSQEIWKVSSSFHVSFYISKDTVIFYQFFVFFKYL